MLFYLFSFQINCVVMNGINEDEICDFVRLTQNKVNRLLMISNNVF